MDHKLDEKAFAHEIARDMKVVRGFAPVQDGLDLTVKLENVDVKAVLRGGDDWRIAPHINLSEFYQKYMSGIAYEDILRQIQNICMWVEGIADVNVNAVYDYSFCKYKVFPVIEDTYYEADSNKKYPFTPFLDLGVTYNVHIPTGRGDEYIDLKVTSEMLDAWKISVEKLHAVAVGNLKQQKQVCIYSAIDIAKDLGKETFLDFVEFDEQDGWGALPIYLSSKAWNGGAAALLDDDILYGLFDTYGPYYVIVPTPNYAILLPESIVEFGNNTGNANCLWKSKDGGNGLLSYEVYHYANGKGLEIGINLYEDYPIIDPYLIDWN